MTGNIPNNSKSLKNRKTTANSRTITLLTNYNNQSASNSIASVYT